MEEGEESCVPFPGAFPCADGGGGVGWADVEGGGDCGGCGDGGVVGGAVAVAADGEGGQGGLGG